LFQIEEEVSMWRKFYFLETGKRNFLLEFNAISVLLSSIQTALKKSTSGKRRKQTNVNNEDADYGSSGTAAGAGDLFTVRCLGAGFASA